MASPAVAEAIAAMEALPRPPPKRTARLLPLIPRAPASLLPPVTMPQWMRDLPPPQVPQGLGWEEKDEGCKPSREELQLQGMQGWWPPLARHPLSVPPPFRCLQTPASFQ